MTSDDGYVYAFTNQAGGELQAPLLGSDSSQIPPQENEPSQPPPEVDPVGIVVHDQAPVYMERDTGSPAELTLNDGVVLQF